MKIGNRFKLDKDNYNFKNDFDKKIFSIKSIYNKKEISNKIPKLQGIYFWILEIDNIFFKVYIGKTNNLNRRIAEQLSNFQPSSPNDYKIRFFMDFLNKSNIEWTLHLHFFDIKEPTKEDLANKENYFIKLYEMNNTGIINGFVKINTDKIRNVYKKYYFMRFKNRLNKI